MSESSINYDVLLNKFHARIKLFDGLLTNTKPQSNEVKPVKGSSMNTPDNADLYVEMGLNFHTFNPGQQATLKVVCMCLDRVTSAFEAKCFRAKYG